MMSVLGNGGDPAIAVGGRNTSASRENWGAVKQLKSSKTSKSKKGLEHGKPNSLARSVLVASSVDMGNQQACDSEKQG